MCDDCGGYPQQGWGVTRRSCPPPCGLLLDFALGHTPPQLLDIAASILWSGSDV